MLDVSKVTLGYIPIGSSNDFARGMQLPKNLKEALEVILSGKQILRMDVGVITRRGKQRRFAVSAGIGFDAAVCHEVCVSPWKRILNKLKLGKLSYAVVALDRLLKDTPVRTVISTDSEGEKVYDKLFFAAAMNQRYEGGGFCFCPHASPGDSMLDIIVVSDLSKLKMLCLLPTAFRGWHVRFKGITILRCKQIAVETEKPLPIHTDGEPVFLSDKIEVCLLPDKLRVITT